MKGFCIDVGRPAAGRNRVVDRRRDAAASRKSHAGVDVFGGKLNA
jgi:hypothetical protein